MQEIEVFFTTLALRDCNCVIREFEIRRQRITTTVKHATAHDQKPRDCSFFPRSPAATVSCWAVSRSRDYGEHFARILPSRQFKNLVFSLKKFSIHLL